MIKISRKILPSFILTAILVIAGGFSDGMNASASMGSMASDASTSNQVMHYNKNFEILRQSMPVDNSLKPCCENSQGGSSAIQVLSVNQDMKISAFGFIENALDNNITFKQKIVELSSASPPGPDVLSSVFKKE